MTDKKELRKQLILNNPNDSGNKLYEKAKAKGISNRKTDFLKEIRDIRDLPEPTTEKKTKSIPIKYRLPKGFEQIDKKGTYGIAEVKNKSTDTSYWIKYDDNSSFRKQLDKIKQEYGDDIEIEFHGTKKYSSFIAQEFRDLLSNYNVEI